jgi:hypothetical protein
MHIGKYINGFIQVYAVRFSLGGLAMEGEDVRRS